MATKTLLSQTGVVGAGGIVNFPGSDDVRTVQFNPAPVQGFSGTVVVEGSYTPQPGANDFIVLVSVTFSGHTNNLSLDIDTDVPFIRARITASQTGAIAVFASSRFGSINGSQGTSPATATIDSALRVAGSGSSFKINSPVVPAITSDDVVYVNNINFTLTEYLDGTGGAQGFQPKIGTGVITSSEADVNVLNGTAMYGLVTADLNKLADVNVSATEINRLTGVTSNVQTQINNLSTSKADGAGIDLTGLTASAADLNELTGQAGMLDFNVLTGITGLTASAADLNVFTGTAGTFTAADMAKLGNITASAAEINVLSGFGGTSTNLNTLVGLNSTTADLNAIDGLAGTGVTTTELAFLSGLTQNVQTALNVVPNLTGLTATVNDLNTLTGIFSGSGGYPGQVTATEIGYLDGLTGSIQTQLNNKRNIGVPIGIAEISGASITTTELNYLQGATSNIQAQIDSLGGSTITPAGANFTGPIYIATGSAAAPSLGYTTATTTGFYLFGTNGIGMTVAGTRFMTLDGTDVVIGDGVTNGTPNMQGTSPSVTNPAYGFNNDDNTGVYWAGADAVGISAGGTNIATFDGANDEIVLGGAVAENNKVRVTGLFEGEKLLGTGQIDTGSGSVVGQTALYNVPVGRTAMITKVYFVINSVTGAPTNDFNVNVGFGGAFDEILDNTNNPSVFNPVGYAFDTALQIMPLGVGDNTFPAVSGSSGADYQLLTSGDTLSADITALDSTATAFVMDIYVIGVEF